MAKTKRAKAKKKAVKKKAGQAVAIYQPQSIVRETGVQVAGMLGNLMHLAERKDIDIARINELKVLILELMKIQQRQAYNADMALLQSEIKPLTPDKKALDWFYVSMERVDDMLRPLTHKYGFAPTFSTEQAATPGWIRLKIDILHRGGHQQTYYAPDVPADTTGPKGGGNKTGVQGAASSMTTMQRHMLKLIFNVPIRGLDKDGQQFITEGQVEALQKLAHDGGVSLDGVLRYANVENLSDIRPQDFGKVVNAIQNTARKKDTEAKYPF